MLKFITGNKNKFLEVKKNLKPLKVEQINLPLDEIQDLDPHKVISHKLNQVFKKHKGHFIVEDDSLYLDCLNGQLPGPFIRWFNDTIGNAGLLKLTQKMGNSNVVLKVIIGYAKSPKEIIFFESDVKGNIVKPKGKGGFGFDLIFKPKKSNKTFAELKAAGNFGFDSRGIVTKKLKNYLLQNDL